MLEYLTEIRKLIIIYLIILASLILILMPFSKNLFDIISDPVLNILPNQNIIATDLSSVLISPLKLVFFSALMLSMPGLMYQVFNFIAPALYKNEKNLCILIMLLSLILFITGSVFAFYFVLPLIFNFFIDFAPDNLDIMPDISKYLNLVIKSIFMFGIGFQIPIIIFLFCKNNQERIKALKSRRSYIIVITFTLAMLVTPPDVISQTLLALPMLILYEVGLYISSKYQSNNS